MAMQPQPKSTANHAADHIHVHVVGAIWGTFNPVMPNRHPQIMGLSQILEIEIAASNAPLPDHPMKGKTVIAMARIVGGNPYPVVAQAEEAHIRGVLHGHRSGNALVETVKKTPECVQIAARRGQDLQCDTS